MTHQEYSEGLSENLLEAQIGCIDDLGEGAEARNQRLRQLLGVAPRQRPEQHELQEHVPIQLRSISRRLEKRAKPLRIADDRGRHAPIRAFVIDTNKHG
jgi:hypothetical protein